MSLQNLNHLEELNLQRTQVDDAALRPLLSFPRLKHLSLKSIALTDLSLYTLSALSKLTTLAIRDAVLTNSGLGLFRPPSTLKLLDLRGCWLLPDDALFLFCKSYPELEVLHELVDANSSDRIGHNRPSPSKVASKAVQANQMPKSAALSESFVGVNALSVKFLYLMHVHVLFHISCYFYFLFTDQRLKYSREELLGMQFSSVSLQMAMD